MAKRILEDFKESNLIKLNQFKVDKSIYGKMDVSGVKDGDPEPCPRTFDPLR